MAEAGKDFGFPAPEPKRTNYKPLSNRLEINY